MDSDKEIRILFINLIYIQNSLKTVKEFLDKKDETANKLSDVWNTLLDCRSNIIKDILRHPIMDAGNCIDQFNRIIQEYNVKL